MGAINFGRGSFIPILSEIIGVRSGLALTEEELRQHAGEGWDDLWTHLDKRAEVRVRSEEFDTLVLTILQKIGATNAIPGMDPFLELAVTAQTNEERELHDSIMEAWSNWIFGELKRRCKSGELKWNSGFSGPPLDPTPFVDDVLQSHGVDAAGIALQLIGRIDEYQRVKPWAQLHMFDRKQVVALEDLFKSESLGVGVFIEQQYLDFMAANKGALAEINWRKFEALTAEFFDREGYEVALGPGRGDGGIDVRVFDANDKSRALILIQCKRYKATVPMIEVKSLYSDMQWEGVERGMIVTTSRLAPSARKTISVRGYDIEEADQATVERWLESLRTPRTPVFFDES